jgi:hypothetical protein
MRDEKRAIRVNVEVVYDDGTFDEVAFVPDYHVIDDSTVFPGEELNPRRFFRVRGLQVEP